MSTSEIECSRDGCGEMFKVGAEDTARCPACGQKHDAPWPHQQGGRADDAETTATEVTAPPGTVVRITIEIEPSENG